MYRDSGHPVLELEQQRDREITLGPMLLTMLGLALAALCAVCFVSGYAIGRQGGGQSQTASTGKEVPSAAQLFGAQPKPSANPTAIQPAAGTQSSAPDAAQAGASEDVAENSASTAKVQAPSRSNTSATAVQAALPVQDSVQNSVVGVQGSVQPALGHVQPATGSWMVQIAAVSEIEDANVLTSALKKHGYGVSAHRDPLDNLIHVQVGPFGNRNDAASMRQRLLNDGYNAIIQP